MSRPLCDILTGSRTTLNNMEASVSLHMIASRVTEHLKKLVTLMNAAEDDNKRAATYGEIVMLIHAVAVILPSHIKSTSIELLCTQLMMNVPIDPDSILIEFHRTPRPGGPRR